MRVTIKLNFGILENWALSVRLRARRVAFLRKKLRKNLFGKGFLTTNGDGANMAVPIFGSAPSICRRQRPSAVAFLWVCPFIVSQMMPECLEGPSNVDLSV